MQGWQQLQSSDKNLSKCKRYIIYVFVGALFLNHKTHAGITKKAILLTLYLQYSLYERLHHLHRHETMTKMPLPLVHSMLPPFLPELVPLALVVSYLEQ